MYSQVKDGTYQSVVYDEMRCDAMRCSVVRCEQQGAPGCNSFGVNALYPNRNGGRQRRTDDADDVALSVLGYVKVVGVDETWD
nr:uncharacterized protein CTRU02_09227 [Colletotrichum truncatum]KAF6788906.1 hypothetical protein CTRU02_09227 [Colletotrichum truncatum]